jgi:energy-coupling factor transport system permease protein
MRSPLAYAPRGGPFGGVGAGAASLYLGSLAVVAFAFSNPIVLAGSGAAIVVAGLGARAGAARAASARRSRTLGVLIVAVNAITAQRGDTILLRGGEFPVLGQIDVTAEALVEGGVLALRIAVVLAAFAVHSACVDPDRMLRMLRPVARHSALTATLITRLVPLAAADHARLREAAALRGPAAAPAGRAALVRRLVAGSLDRAVDVAAALELRGYARGAPREAGRRPASRHSWRFAAAGAAIVVVALVARLAGIGDFDAYPTTSIAAGGSTLALAAALPLLAAAPFLGLGRRDG